MAVHGYPSLQLGSERVSRQILVFVETESRERGGEDM